MVKVSKAVIGVCIFLIAAVAWSSPVLLHASGNIPTYPQPVEAFYGQAADCANVSIRYTKLDANGDVVLPDALTTPWVMVKDNCSGLIWENKTDDYTIHDKDNMYGWAESTSSFIGSLNNQRFGGNTDWRMPTIDELKTIVKIGTRPTIDGEYFPNTVASFYWSSTTDAYNTVYAWGVNFYYGYDSNYYKYGSHYVRAVRGGQSGSLGNLAISPSSQSVTKDAGTTSFTVYNSDVGMMSWTATVTSGGDWLSITSGNTGTNAATITCAYDANPTALARTGTITVTVTAPDGTPGSHQIVEVVQARSLYYMAKTVGSWSTIGTWKTNETGGTNPEAYTTDATTTPTAANSLGIIIDADVSVDVDVTIDQTTINADKTLTVNGSKTLTVADGTDTDLTITGTLKVIGTLTNSGTITCSSGSIVDFAASADQTYELNYQLDRCLIRNHRIRHAILDHYFDVLLSR